MRLRNLIMGIMLLIHYVRLLYIPMYWLLCLPVIDKWFINHWFICDICDLEYPNICHAMNIHRNKELEIDLDRDLCMNCYSILMRINNV